MARFSSIFFHLGRIQDKYRRRGFKPRLLAREPVHREREVSPTGVHRERKGSPTNETSTEPQFCEDARLTVPTLLMITVHLRW